MAKLHSPTLKRGCRTMIPRELLRIVNHSLPAVRKLLHGRPRGSGESGSSGVADSMRKRIPPGAPGVLESLHGGYAAPLCAFEPLRETRFRHGSPDPIDRDILANRFPWLETL